METRCFVPGLLAYLKQDSATAYDKKVAVIAYKYKCTAAVENFEASYVADNNFDLNEKHIWKQDTKLKKTDYNISMRVSNKAVPTEQLKLSPPRQTSLTTRRG